ncbi:KilA-N domain-containing protein [Halomonas beimenensis]|uniref:KilA-N domain-containing protein n=1 Tax=Halomonas beimenensis TaxID=475662 RepID=A0A291P571_9GAMM|nr:KilA-N domain-containing protein [Halomonas beimenensis]ATJ82030.1 hypothetical protein BEI_1043 [Halomonas beimenensis]
MSNTQLTVADIAVRQDSEGRFNLNDLHKAAGGERRFDTREFLDREQTKELVAELESQMTEIPVNKKRGRYGGTFVVKELVYAYAMWISPAFNLKVIRAFDQPRPKAWPWPITPPTTSSTTRSTTWRSSSIRPGS